MKYGDVPGLLALAAPHAVVAGRAREAEPPAIRPRRVSSGRAGRRLTTYAGSEDREAAAAVEWLLK